MNVGATKAGEGWGLWLLAVEAKFPGGAVGSEAGGELEGRSRAGGYGWVRLEAAEGQESGGLVEAEAGS